MMASALKPRGCFQYIFGIVVIVVVLNTLVWILGVIFKASYPITSLTENLVPFQNNYLAFTSAYVTSESPSEFTANTGPVSRFISLAGLSFVTTMVIGLFFYLVPSLRSLIVHLLRRLFLPLLILSVVIATFLPSMLTTLNVDQKKMTITKFEWLVIPSRVSYDFSSIEEFGYTLHEEIDSEYEDRVIANLFIVVDGKKVFIAQNQVGFHNRLEAWNLPSYKKIEIEKAIESLKMLTQ